MKENLPLKIDKEVENSRQRDTKLKTFYVTSVLVTCTDFIFEVLETYQQSRLYNLLYGLIAGFKCDKFLGGQSQTI